LWKEHFRVTRETFEYLCDLVRVDLQKQHTRFRSLVSVEERVGLALWRLATGNSYRSSIDGCHIEINAPPDNHEDYFNRKQHYSYPGSIHDARVLRLSGLYELAENEQILSGPTCNINGTEVRPLLAGDSAYPLTNWLVKPYPDRGRLTPEQRKFNIKFSALRSVVERAFGTLKARWRIALKKVEQKYEHPKKDFDCCVRFAQHLY
ncbi:unnamed protein product, partial [Porites evermanni]